MPKLTWAEYGSTLWIFIILNIVISFHTA